jgi:hypothetical protein
VAAQLVNMIGVGLPWQELSLAKALDQPHGVDGLGDEFELVALAMAILQDFRNAGLSGEEKD